MCVTTTSWDKGRFKAGKENGGRGTFNSIFQVKSATKITITSQNTAEAFSLVMWHKQSSVGVNIIPQDFCSHLNGKLTDRIPATQFNAFYMRTTCSDDTAHVFTFSTPVFSPAAIISSPSQPSSLLCVFNFLQAAQQMCRDLCHWCLWCRVASDISRGLASRRSFFTS